MTVATLKPIMRKIGGKDYLDILDPDRSDVELNAYCQCVLNRCALLTCMQNFSLGCTGKTESSFMNNVLGLIIWKHMHGIAWVRNTLLNIEKNPKDVANVSSYKEYVKMNEPELW